MFYLELFLFAIAFRFPLRQGEGEINVWIHVAKGFDKCVVPFRLQGKYGILFSDKNRELFRVRIELQSRNVLDREGAFNESELRGVVFPVNHVLRFDKNGKHDHDTRRTNEDKQRGLQGFNKAVNLPTTRNTEGTYDNPRNAQYNGENGEKDHFHR